MKMRFVLMTMFAVMAISCTKENLPENNMTDAKPALVPMEFVAGLETKAAITDITGTQCVVEWNDNDAISVFDNLGGINAFTTQTGGATAVFAGQVSEGATEFYALYPSRTNLEFAADTKIATSKLFPDQNAVLGSYASGNGGAVMAAKVSEGNLLSFKNMTSHIRFTLAEDLTDVKSITLMGNKGEAVAGLYTIDFSGDVPVLAVSKPETYVTLRNANGEALTPGDYFFTILPVEFTEGFTVILSKTNGTQVAKKTAKNIDSVKDRNKILPMAKLASTDYASHLNYFVKYNDGFNLTFGGYTFNKSVHGNATHVAANTAIDADGVYFVPVYSNGVEIGYNQCRKLFIIGAETACRSSLICTKTLQPQTDETGCVVFANLELINTDKKRLFEQPSNAEFQFEKFGSIILSNCKVNSILQHLCNFNSKVMTLDNLVLEDNDYLISGNDGNKFVLNTNKMASTINNVVVRNNVFEKISGTVGDFKLVNGLNGTGATIGNITVVQNTLVNTLTKGTGYIYVGKATGVANIYDNLYVESHQAGTLTYILNAASYDTTFGCSIKNNFFYVAGATKALQAGNTLPAAVEGVIAYGRPRPLIEYPLVAKWSAQNGVFGYKSNLQYYDNIGDTDPEGNVSANCGAQRTVVEPANSAAANYSSVDLGNL